MASRRRPYDNGSGLIMAFAGCPHRIAGGLLASLAVFWVTAAGPLFPPASAGWAVVVTLTTAVIAATIMLVAAVGLAITDLLVELTSRKARVAMDVMAIDQVTLPVEASDQNNRLYPIRVNNVTPWAVLDANRLGLLSSTTEFVADSGNADCRVDTEPRASGNVLVFLAASTGGTILRHSESEGDALARADATIQPACRAAVEVTPKGLTPVNSLAPLVAEIGHKPQLDRGAGSVVRVRRIANGCFGNGVLYPALRVICVPMKVVSDITASASGPFNDKISLGAGTIRASPFARFRALLRYAERWLWENVALRAHSKSRSPITRATHLSLSAPFQPLKAAPGARGPSSGPMMAPSKCSAGSCPRGARRHRRSFSVHSPARPSGFTCMAAGSAWMRRTL
jgi:hypothetical protein